LGVLKISQIKYSQYNEEFEDEVLALLLTDLERNALPTNNLGNGQFAPKPAIPGIPALPVLAHNANVATERQHDQNVMARKYIMSKRQSILQASNDIKDLFESEAILGAINCKAAIRDGTMMQRMADTTKAMRATLCMHLGTPDLATYADWERIYSNPAADLDVAEWIRLEGISNKALTLSPSSAQSLPAHGRAPQVV
jgi:hypothetical protein